MSLHLDRLKRRHGWTGESYRDLVKAILARGIGETSKTAASFQRAALSESARRAGASLTGNLLLPPAEGAALSRDAVLRKAAQDGDLVTDTLRDRLQRRLRRELADFYSKPGAKLERGEERGRIGPGTVDRFERAVREVLEPYCRRMGKPAPSNCRAIADTEVRSSASLAKEAYAQSVANANASRFRVYKVWRHRPQLSKEPRDGHAEVDGQRRALGDAFRVPLTDSKGRTTGYTSMMHPHDPSAPLEQVISCHCECDYVVVPVPRRGGADFGTPETRQEREDRWDSGVMKSVAVDLDGTLALYDGYRGPAAIGAPIRGMVDRVRGWLDEGREVKVFTARVSSSNPPEEVEAARAAIRRWCLSTFGRELEVTADKDPGMEEFWDDRAHGVEANTGVEKDGGRRLAGRVEFHGLPISLEHNKGGVREGVDGDGRRWRTKMLFPYGYIKGTRGADGDAVDCFLGDDRDSEAVFIVHTYRPGTVEYDEDKVMLGFTSAVEARRWLEAHYDRYVVQSVEETDVEGLKGLLEACRGGELSVTKDQGTGKVDIGGRIRKPDGSTWERTGPYSYKKVLNPDGSPYQSRSKGTNAGRRGAAAPVPDQKAPAELPGMSASRAREILQKYGDKGVWNLTREGLYNLLTRYGVDPAGMPFKERQAKAQELVRSGAEFKEPAASAPAAKPEPTKVKADPMAPEPGQSAEDADGRLRRMGPGGLWGLTAPGLNNWLRSKKVDPSKLKFAEKHEAAKRIMREELERDKVENTVKLKRHEPYTNKGIMPRYDSTRGISRDELLTLERDAEPRPGGHWGAADSRNVTALAVALSSAPRYRPIDKVEDGKLQDFEAVVSFDVAKMGVQLRKYAQERISRLSRDKQPSFFRGMTLDSRDWESIAKGESDTIELTGCTAFSCYEKIADRYSRSSWTKGFGRDRKAVKIVLERDDDVDGSIGMWHRTFSEKNGGEEQPAFELLSGLEAVRVVRVEGAGEADENKALRTKAVNLKRRTIKQADRGIETASGNVKYYQEMLDKGNYRDSLTRRIEEARNGARNEETRWRSTKAATEAFDFKEPKNATAIMDFIKGYYGYGEGRVQFHHLMARVKRDEPIDPESQDYLRFKGLIDDDGNPTDLGRVAVYSMWSVSAQYAYNLAQGAPGRRLVLHCVAGRGKKSVTGGNEESPDNA